VDEATHDLRGEADDLGRLERPHVHALRQAAPIALLSTARPVSTTIVYTHAAHTYHNEVRRRAVLPHRERLVHELTSAPAHPRERSRLLRDERAPAGLARGALARDLEHERAERARGRVEADGADDVRAGVLVEEEVRGESVEGLARPVQDGGVVERVDEGRAGGEGDGLKAGRLRGRDER
jgi:hypothetical protein